MIGGHSIAFISAFICLSISGISFLQDVLWPAQTNWYAVGYEWLGRMKIWWAALSRGIMLYWKRMYAASHTPVFLAGHSDSIVMTCAHNWWPENTSRLRRVANTSSFLLYHSLETKLVHGCAVCGIAHLGNIVPRRDVIWHEVAPGFFQYDFIVLDL